AGFEPLASWPVEFERETDHGLAAILAAGSLGLPCSGLDPERAPHPAAFLPTRRMFLEELGGALRSLRNNRDLLEALRTVPARRPLTPPGRQQEDEARLRRITCGKLGSIYGASRPAAERLEMELREIGTAGLAGYFLLFADVVEYCRSRSILAVARGSAAGSLVARLIGLSAVCPIRHDLSFARFFNRLRPDPPDIDLDIDGDRREEVLRWALERTGRNAAGVSELVRLRTRGAFRTVAAALGLGREETDELASTLPAAAEPVWKTEPLAGALELARRLTGVASHVAPHPCGVALGNEPLEGVVGIEGCRLGIDLAQFDKDGVEWMGMLKMDLLGQRGLSTLGRACSSTGANAMRLLTTGRHLEPDVREMLGSGRTIGVCHIESPAMRDLLRQTRARTLEDVGRALALVRPGAAASGGRKRFFAERGLDEETRRLFPSLPGLLADNRGVLLYQEDVALVAREVLGLDDAEADLLRRRLKKGLARESDLRALCLARGMDARASEVLWRLLSGYAGYGFCKSHAMTYAAVACASTAMKAKAPAQHFAAVLASGGGFYGGFVYLEEARRLGVRLRVPGVNSGDWLASCRDGELVTGFNWLRGMGRADYDLLAAGRPYPTTAGVLERGLAPATLATMALAGCFNELGVTAPQALLMIETRSGRREGADLLGGLEDPAPGLPGYDPTRRAGLEMGLLGASVTGCPLGFCDRPPGTLPGFELALRAVPGEVRCWGMPAARRSLEDGSGFMMLMDETGVVDAYLPSAVYRRAVVLSRRQGSTLVLSGKMVRAGRMDADSVDAGPLTPEPMVV
ncbi:hypothetical protein JW921_01045, partial [Candidatus Fermentibacterales bacterium]|nr:hypothetical protein [Candidatus Fermentibacterales bacterium]